MAVTFQAAQRIWQAITEHRSAKQVPNATKGSPSEWKALNGNSDTVY